MDTLYADVSSYQVTANDKYPYRFIAFRSNDGTYRDTHFANNLVWANSAVKSGKLVGYLVYFVWEPNWSQTIETFEAMVGTGHRRRMAVMIDVESWKGRIKGDHSSQINATREALILWLNSQRPSWQRSFPFRKPFLALDRRRVIGYGNAGDLSTIWPNRGDAKVVLANYSSNPDFPGKIAHQFSSHFNVPPFGFCDINSADGRSPRQFAWQLGLGRFRWSRKWSL